MISYRFRRRAFITAMSGGVGLKIMLRNLESAAQGMRSPARLLVTHWPVGIVAGQNDALWKPTSGSVGGSPGLRPFADAGLGQDMTVLRGLSTVALPSNGSGGHEGGTVMLMTGLGPPGTRAGELEADDAYAGGPSIDQILLKNVPALQRPGQGYANSISDARTDFGEISTKCLSYSTELQSVNAFRVDGAMEAKPLMSVVSPVQQYANLFSTFAPGTPGTGGQGGQGGQGGGAPPPVADATLKQLVGKRSVLDFAVDELTQLKRMAPSDARNKLSVHTDAVVTAEQSVVNAINMGYPDPGGGAGAGGSTGGGGGGGGAPACGGCTTKSAPPASNIVGTPDKAGGLGNPFGTGGNLAAQDDSPMHAMVGRAHMDILKAAFICDLIRVGTYQWSPGTNHASFALYPGTTQPYMHHPTSHHIQTQDTLAASTLSALKVEAAFLYNVQLWYFARHAENLASWKSAVDGCGNSLLDFTCVPFLTEVAACGHERNNMPGMIIGGKQLGFVHNIYRTGAVTINQFWGTIAQAFGYTSTDAPFAPPIDGLWAQP
ncbi:MAG TPA: DUF1552 domain-containing protein [Polyangia bacterium]|jgi:hypothetical protein